MRFVGVKVKSEGLSRSRQGLWQQTAEDGSPVPVLSQLGHVMRHGPSGDFPPVTGNWVTLEGYITASSPTGIFRSRSTGMES